MATRTWISTGSTDMNNSANYDGTGSLLTTDDLLFNNSSGVAATATGNLSVNSVTTGLDYTNNWSMSAYALTCGQGASYDHTGTLTMGTPITCNGSSATLHVGSSITTLGYATLVLNGTDGMVVDWDRAGNQRGIVIGENAKVTWGGSGVLSIVALSDPALTMNNNSLLTVNTAINLYRNTSGEIYSIGSDCTFNGATVTITISANATTDATVPALNYTGTGTLTFRGQGAVNPVFHQTGNISGTGNINLQSNNGAGAVTFNTNNHNITASGELRVGLSTAPTTGSFTLNCGTSTITCNSHFGNNSYSNRSYINLQKSRWYVSGNFLTFVNHVLDPGTSVVTLVGGNATATMAGKLLDTVYVNKSGTLTLSDQFVCHRFQRIAGTIADSHRLQVLGDAMTCEYTYAD